MERKAQLGLLKTAGILFIVTAITISIGQQILSDMVTDIDNASSYADNTTVDGQEGLNELSEWFDTIGLVIAAAVILAIVAWFASVNR